MKRKDIFLDLIMLGTVSVIFNLVDIRICPFFYLFNIPCPGCGLTRSVLAIFKLDLKSSVQYNFLGIIIVILNTHNMQETVFLIFICSKLLLFKRILLKMCL